ncbi:hypothetical protein Zmor_012943 [Zophobas morio]|uniref:Uncharacterized protein n=1 Tax=Zophobas morio TaxID=2755281 RepID=A0AA38MEV0_9CUCU|nr:hypothetical protein Zmor_012943 [Zophobas morio]
MCTLSPSTSLDNLLFVNVCVTCNLTYKSRIWWRLVSKFGPQDAAAQRWQTEGVLKGEEAAEKGASRNPECTFI